MKHRKGRKNVVAADKFRNLRTCPGLQVHIKCAVQVTRGSRSIGGPGDREMPQRGMRYTSIDGDITTPQHRPVCRGLQGSLYRSKLSKRLDHDLS